MAENNGGSRFYNPYQFIAVDTDKCIGRTPYAKIEDLNKPENFARHDFWQKEAKSGSIRCTLKTLSPLVVGGKQTAGSKEKKTEGRVAPYRNKRGQVAIPGNSLRGMISSVSEIISQSAMRVMNTREEDFYSTRMQTSEAFKELGLLCKRDGDWYIHPLGEGVSAYNYNDEIDSLFIRKQQCYHAVHNPKLLTYYDEKNNESYSEGIYYVRGEHESMPKKLHETYLPWDGRIIESELIPIDKVHIDQLEYMLRERYQTDDEFPYLPRGYEQHERSWTDSNKPLVLEGDLIYYKSTFSLAARKTLVNALSYSAIGRRMVQGKLRDAFESEYGQDSLPWGKHRNALTPAEALFGVVEDDVEKGSDARSLASRLHFTDAKTLDNADVELLSDKTLKILNSPKPPSPTMYFSGASGKYIGKDDLNLNEHAPNGRKCYLVHQPDNPGERQKYRFETRLTGAQYRPWMHLICKPIPENTDFSFDIHFENLSADELGLLCRAITPDSAFIHRLGLGKPLGLGHVRITEMQININQRKQRYTAKHLLADDNAYEIVEPPVTSSLISNDLLQQLIALGDRDRIDLPVCYPYSESATLKQSAYGESEGYEWFVCNDRAAHNQDETADYTGQYLRPLTTNQNGKVVIPTLDADIYCPVKHQKGGGQNNKKQAQSSGQNWRRKR